MSEVPTEHLQLQKIREKATEILAKLDNPEDPQVVDVLSSVAVVPEESGAWTAFNTSVTADIVTVDTNKLKVLGFFFYTDADIEARLRFKNSGHVIGGIKGKGLAGMNLTNMKKPEGAAGEDIELYISGTGSVRGWISTVEVAP